MRSKGVVHTALAVEVPRGWESPTPEVRKRGKASLYAGLILAVLVASISGYLYAESIYVPQVQARDATIADQLLQISALESNLTSLLLEGESLRSELSRLGVQIRGAQETILNLTNLLDAATQRVEYLENPRDFNNMNELQTFLSNDNTDSHEYVPVRFDCDDFATTLWLNSLRAGYKMYTVVVHDAVLTYITKGGIRYYNVSVAWGISVGENSYWIMGNHMMNLCFVRGVGWCLVEPQSDGVYILHTMEL